MQLTKFEQSGFIIETNNGYRLALDIGNKTPLEKLNNITVDAFLVSHVHGDHFSLPQINSLKPNAVYLSRECQQQIQGQNLPIKTIKSQDYINLSNEIDIQVFSVDHGPNISTPLAENFGFLINADKQSIYFAGDMFSESGIEVTNLEIDYTLIPIGGFYTFGPQEAFNFIKKFKSIKKVIPIHYDSAPENKDTFYKLATDKFKLD